MGREEKGKVTPVGSQPRISGFDEAVAKAGGGEG